MPQGSRPENHIRTTEMSEMLSLVRRSVEALAIDIAGLNVVAPAVRGYEATATTIALLAGASTVTAIALPSTRFHSAEEAANATVGLAELAGFEDRVTVQERIDHHTCASANIVISSGPVRPITRSVIERLPRHAVVSMLGETWKLIPGEIDVAACQEHGIPISGVNENHPEVGGLTYQPALCLRMLRAAEVEVRGAMIALVCDNPLGQILERGLRAGGAQVFLFATAHDIMAGEWQGVVLAQRPGDQVSLGIRELGMIAKAAPKAVIVQYWGDIDRTAARYFELRVWPPRTPGKGQMGMPLEALGPEPTVRLIAGGLKAAQLALEGKAPSPDSLLQLFGR